jgi:hypothetical protein
MRTGLVLGVHFGVAFVWSGVYLLAYRRIGALRRVILDAGGVALVSALYGPMIWTLMSRVFIPWTTGSPAPPVTARWGIQ